MTMETWHYLCIWLTIWGLCQVHFSNGQPDDLTFQLLARVESLEKQGRQQNEVIEKMQEDLSHQAVEHRNQKSIIETQQQQLSYQTVRLTEQQTHLDDQGIKLLAQQKHVKQLESTIRKCVTKLKPILKESIKIDEVPKLPWTDYLLRNQKGNLTLAAKEDMSSASIAQPKHVEYATNDQADRIPKEVIRPSRFIADAEGPVAFQARIDTHEVKHIGINQNIVFDVIEINLGGGYHGQHGVFIAPQPGIYIFSTSILSGAHGSGDGFSVVMVKNGVAIGGAAGYFQSWGNDTGSVSAVTQLQTGDEVWIKLIWPVNANIRGDGYSSFMGCLVTPM